MVFLSIWLKFGEFIRRSFLRKYIYVGGGRLQGAKDGNFSFLRVVIVLVDLFEVFENRFVRF